MSKTSQILITLSEYTGFRLSLNTMSIYTTDGYLTDENGEFITDENNEVIPIL